LQFRRQKSAEVSVNLTPLIDVVFLLLIFFMVSTTFTQETHLNLDLPEATGEDSESVAKQIEIVISVDGQYVLNGRSLVNNKLITLRKALSELAGNNLTTPLVITADANTPHQAVITAMDAAGQEGFSHLSLTTQKPTEK
jgi:biopolymer transport protein ExbD